VTVSGGVNPSEQVYCITDTVNEKPEIVSAVAPMYKGYPVVQLADLLFSTPEEIAQRHTLAMRGDDDMILNQPSMDKSLFRVNFSIMSL